MGDFMVTAAEARQLATKKLQIDSKFKTILEEIKVYAKAGKFNCVFQEEELTREMILKLSDLGFQVSTQIKSGKTIYRRISW
jgi:hypothetical protein